jgi:nucleotide-binding universal stress UspA family protein
MRLDRIVVGVDFRASSVAALRWVARYLAPGAELVLVHAVVLPEPPGAPRPDAARETRRAAAYDAAARRLRELRRSLPGRRARLEITEGSPAEVIARVARAYDADLVVVGPHGERPGALEQLGSTAERLVRRSPVPVLLATGELAGPPRRLLVPVRAPDISPSVLRWADALERRFDARLALVHVTGAAPALAMAGADEDEADVVEEPRWRHLAAAAPAGRVFTDAAWGDPTEAILAEAERFDSDLIVLDDRTLRAIHQALADEPADPLLRAAGCAVLVVVARDVG